MFALFGLQLPKGLAATSANPRKPTTREVKLLVDGWRFHLGHASDVDLDFGFGRDQRTFAKASQTALPALADFEDSEWIDVHVPHDWAVNLPFAKPSGSQPEQSGAAHGFKALGRDYPENSVGWYRRTLAINPEDEGRAIWLEFDGVFRDARIFVNGFQAHREASGYAPFSVNIADFLDYSGGQNILAVRVDASLGEGWFYEGAGIYRDARLIKTNAVHVPIWGICVRSLIGPVDATVSIMVQVENAGLSAAEISLSHTIIDPEGRPVG